MQEAAHILAGISFPLNIVSLTGKRFTINVSKDTTLRSVYTEVSGLINIPVDRFYLEKNLIKMPRVEDYGVDLPLSAYNITKETTVAFILRLGANRPSPYQRKDWFLKF